MRIPIFQVDAFTSRLFAGNPAAVCVLERWLPSALLQAIAAENNLSETAFLLREREAGYALRWFTPTTEVDLCGHATLAAGYVVFERLDADGTEVVFRTRSGKLTVRRAAEAIELEMPRLPAKPCPTPAALIEGLGSKPREVLRATNYLCVFASEDEVATLRPDFRRLAELHPYGVIATAPARECDFVSRFFAPSFGIDEDPVTGSAHCTLTPYWSGRLEKRVLHARQISPRGGELVCTHRPSSVVLEGYCRMFFAGTIELDDSPIFSGATATEAPEK